MLWKRHQGEHITIHVSVIPDSGMRVHVAVRALSTTLDLVMPYYVRKELLATSDCCDMIYEFILWKIFECYRITTNTIVELTK